MQTNPQVSSAAVRRSSNHQRWGNACLRTEERDGTTWVVKDYHCTPRLVRNSLGRFFVWRERRACERLRGLAGFSTECGCPDPLMFRYRFIPGETLRDARNRGAKLGKEYFVALEDLVLAMHRRNAVHLDLRNARNVLVRDDGLPAVLDLQTALFCDHMPDALCRMLKAVDRSAVYKHWRRLSPETLDAERAEWLRRFERVRPWWPFQGYALQRLAGHRKVHRSRAP